MNVRHLLDERFSAALAAAAGIEDAPARVAPAGRPEFGHYQVNGIMPVAKRLKTNPRELAQKVLDAVDLAAIAEAPTIAGPGFINVTLRPEWIAAQLADLQADERLGSPLPRVPQTVVVDYSAPNLAKEMHVGHLRSTIIGDALARVLKSLGHTVIRQNHVGDWGTQFGMLVAHMSDMALAGPDMSIPDLEAYYVEARKRFDTDPDFAERARAAVVELHRDGPEGQSEATTKWEQYRRASLEHCYEVYDRLGIAFASDYGREKWQPKGLAQVPMASAPPDESGIDGESYYNDMLPEVLTKLDAKGMLKESDGAQCVFLDEFKGKDGEPLPVIVQKADGGYLYSTTDLAAICYRVNSLGASRMLYVVDARQRLHFRQIFAVARAAGFASDAVCLEHVPFGMMMGPDGRPFKTREGGTVKLMDLLTRAEQRAAQLVAEKSPDLPAEELEQIAHSVGIGAVKYADLCQHRTSDYLFSFENMLSNLFSHYMVFELNTKNRIEIKTKTRMNSCVIQYRIRISRFH